MSTVSKGSASLLPLSPWDHIDAWVVEVDVNGRIVRANEAFEQGVGRSVDELKGEDALIHLGETGPWFERTLLGAATRNFETFVGGEEVSWRMYPVAGGREGFLLFGEPVDASQRLLSVESSRQAEVYQFALDASAIVATTDARGNITYVNERFCEVAQYEREEVIGKNHNILNSGLHDRAFFKDMWATIGRGQVWRGDIRNRAKDGSYYWVSTTIVPVLDHRGNPKQYMAIRYEITERKMAEAALERMVRELALAREQDRLHAEQLEHALLNLQKAHRTIREEQAKLVQAEKLSSIGLLASGVAHEVNNPLAGVMACIKRLRHNELKAERREEYFETVQEGLERIQSTVRALLDFSRQQKSADGDYDGASLVQSCSRLVAPAAGRKNVLIDLDEVGLGASIFRVDRGNVLQGIMNLLVNAVQASPNGARVKVGIASPREGHPEQAGIRVRDEGPGMTADVLDKARDPFFSTKPEGEGTGLGLAVTSSVALAHGGDLTFDSRPGAGTTAILWLPLADAR
ncbi:MAG: PAS domain-containing sensor histidine kinase [Myxococcota bacterium]